MNPLGLLLAALLLATAAFAASELTPTNYGDMEPVVFNHTDHAGRIDCSRCHHNSTMEHRCGYCHKDQERDGVPSLEDAAHGEETGKCWGCHRKEKARHALDCEDCHSG